MNGLLKGAKASTCGEVVVNTSSVVPVGSSISASCLINNDCPLTKGKQFRVEWKINNDLVPSNLSYLESNGTYIVVIPHIDVARAVITCSVCVEDNCQVVDGSLVKVAYPPPIPTNLSCALNVSNTIEMLCQWDPGQKMENIDLTYTLHTKRGTTRFLYVLPAGVHSYRIPRQNMSLFLEMEIHVEVENTFWYTSSERLLVVPMKTAKYGPPEIQGIEDHELGCLQYRWSLTESQNWVKLTFDVELILKEVNNKLAKELVISKRASQGSTIKVCGLSHWTNYSAKIRVRYYNLWSEWSDPKVATTLSRAPTGRLDTWLKVPADGVTAKLYWKPSQQFRAYGANLSYIVELKPKQTLCVTTEDHCSFNISKRVRKVYLTAQNGCGKSTPTEVPVYRMKALDPVSNLSVHPQSNTSVLLVWESLVSSRVTGYILEYRSLNESLAAKLFFTLLKKNCSSTVVTGLEPFKPYEISIYPKYMDGIGRSRTVMVYTSEKAPSVAPTLNFEKLDSSNVQLVWDEIPLEQRNGIIQGYTIFIWDEKHNIQILKTKKTNVLMKHIQPFSTYHALISVHTLGGSLNGSVVTLTTEQIGHIEIVLFVIPVCVGFSLLILIAVFACLGKHERLKMCLWPIIPDPANSSIRRWTTTDSLQGMPPFKEDKDPALVYLSHFSLLDLSDKEICNSDYVKDNLWSYDSGSHDEGHNLFQTPSSYDSQQDTDSVPYATVLFSGPYQNQTGSPPVYLRSESTQPLLGVESESGSPPPYENISERASKVNYFTTFPLEPTENEAIWEDFPMLRSLEIRITDQI